MDAALAGRLLDTALLALPGILTVYFAFNAGGFFPGTPALVAIALALILVLRVTLADAPLAGFSWPLAGAAGALSLYALWILLSATWSDAPARALVEFDRTLVYLLALMLFGSIPRNSNRLRWIVRGLWLGIVVVASVALATRLLPDVFQTAPNLANNRLSFPLTYWNALGLLGALGAVLSLHISSSLHEPPAMRALASAAQPIIASTAFFTFSRGAIGAGIIGLATYMILGRPRGLAPALIATVPTTVAAVMSANGAELLATRQPTTAAAAAQGHDVAVVVLLCAFAAATLRAILLPLDRRLARFRLPSHLRRPVTRSAWALSSGLALIVVVAAGVPQWASDNYDRFVHTTSLTPSKDLRRRLIDPANNGRIDEWKVAVRGFHRQPVLGQGAGTYPLLWSEERPPSLAGLVVRDAHSLYVEALDELGILGLLLLIASLGAILASLAPVRRGPNRSLYAAVFAAAAIWVIHAGVDWDWEMPAVTIWIFALGGTALAVRKRSSIPQAPMQPARVLLGLGLVVTAVGPALVFASQRHLDTAVDAYNRGDCSKTIGSAAASISALEIRPEPYEAIAYCQARRGNDRLAVEAMEKAVERDPENWEFRYGLALVRGAAGLDPRPAASTALRLNPQDPLTRDLVSRLRRTTGAEGRRFTAALAQRESLSVVR